MYVPYNCSLLPNTTLWVADASKFNKTVASSYLRPGFIRFSLANRYYSVTNPTGFFSVEVPLLEVTELLYDSKPFDDAEVALVSRESCQAGLSSGNYMISSSDSPVSGEMQSFAISTCEYIRETPNGWLNEIQNTGDPWYLSGSYKSATVDTAQWTVLITIPRHNFFSSIDENTIGSVVISVVLFIVSVLVSIFLTMYITRPLDYLSIYLKRLASGEVMEKPTDQRGTRFQEFEGIFHAEEQVHGLISSLNTELLVTQEDKLELTRQVNQLQMQLAATVGDNVAKKALSIFIGTWNVGNAEPDADLTDWLRGRYDLYVIGVQECVYGANSQDHFYSLLKRTLGSSYLKLAGANIVSGNLRTAHISKVKKNQPKEDVQLEQGVTLRDVTGSGGLRLVIFIREEHLQYVRDVKVSREATGIAHVMWNKGGVGISFEIYRTQLCFITSHLAAHQQKIRERNSDFHEILEGLKLGQKHSIIHTFPYVFWCGDLNYRIEMTKDEILEDLEINDFSRMKKHDQLNMERSKNRVFCDFQEAEINFPPTYKFERGINEYESKQGRIPSWCDRVLYSHWPNLKVDVKEYDYTPKVQSSDHRPVFSVLNIQCPLPYIPLGCASSCVLIIRNLKFFQKEIKEMPELILEAPEGMDGESGSDVEEKEDKKKKKKKSEKKKEKDTVNVCTKPHVKLDKRSFMDAVPYRKYSNVSENGLVYSFENIIHPLTPSEKRFMKEQHIILTFANDPDSWKSDRHRQVGQAVLSLTECVASAGSPTPFEASVSRGGVKRNVITGELVFHFGKTADDMRSDPDNDSGSLWG